MKTFRSLFALCAALFAFLPRLGAEMFPPRRGVEAGFTADAMFGQNWRPFPDILFPQNGKLKIDMSALRDELSSGLKLGAAGGASVFLNINSEDSFRLGFSSALDMNFGMEMSRELIAFLAEGNPGGAIDASASVYGSCFADSTFSVTVFPVINGKKALVTITPSAFFPVFAVAPGSSARFAVRDDGSIGADADIAVYSAFPLDGSGGEGCAETRVFAAAGSDISARLEYPAAPGLDAAVTLRHIPLSPGYLFVKTALTGTIEADMESILAGDMSLEDFGTASSEVLDTPYRIARPFAMGAEVSWRPISWFTLRGSAGCVFDDTPYGEYALGAEARILKLLYLSASSHCEERFFAQRVSLTLNFRAVEIGVMLQSCSPDFARSFTLSGLGAGLSFKAGW